jgi:hypothetical protein
MTAHKASMDHDVSASVARWNARTCKALLCPQAAQAPCVRLWLTPCSTQLCTPDRLFPLRSCSFALTITTIGEPAPLKMHR